MAITTVIESQPNKTHDDYYRHGPAGHDDYYRHTLWCDGDYYRHNPPPVHKTVANHMYAELIQSVCTQHPHNPAVRTIVTETFVHRIPTNRHYIRIAVATVNMSVTGPLCHDDDYRHGVQLHDDYYRHRGQFHDDDYRHTTWWRLLS